MFDYQSHDLRARPQIALEYHVKELNTAFRYPFTYLITVNFECSSAAVGQRGRQIWGHLTAAPLRLWRIVSLPCKALILSLRPSMTCGNDYSSAPLVRSDCSPLSHPSIQFTRMERLTNMAFTMISCLFMSFRGSIISSRGIDENPNLIPALLRRKRGRRKNFHLSQWERAKN